jgi:hypothetical protein
VIISLGFTTFNQKRIKQLAIRFVLTLSQMFSAQILRLGIRSLLDANSQGLLPKGTNAALLEPSKTSVTMSLTQSLALEHIFTGAQALLNNNATREAILVPTKTLF